MDMRRPDDLSRGPLRPDALRKLAKGLYNVKVRSVGRGHHKVIHERISAGLDGSKCCDLKLQVLDVIIIG
jgi:hypothetical protein